jgi:hypothetical protein
LRKSDDLGIVIASGKDCFSSYSKKLDHELHKFKVTRFTNENPGEVLYPHDIDRKLKRVTILINDIIHIYDEYYRDSDDDLGHYFGNLFQVLSFVDKTNAPINKREYTSLIRAQLSSYELMFLFYHGLSFWGQIDFKPLIEQYGLLHYLDKKLVHEVIRDYSYDNKAFVR